MKKLILSMLMVLCMGFTFAQNNNLYKDAPKEVVDLIQKADELISQKKYLSAYDVLESSELKENEYVLYKRYEMLNNYAVILSPTTFGIKNLSKKETIEELRQNGTSYDKTITFDAESLVKPKLNKKNPILYLTMGLYYSRISIQNKDKNKAEYEKYKKIAMEQLSVAEKAGLYDSFLCISMGAFYLYEQDFVNATPYFKKGTEIEPNNIMFQNNYGICLRTQGRYKEAIEPIKKTLSLITDTYMLGYNHCNLAELYIAIGEYDSAIDTLIKGSKIAKTYGDIPYLLGYVYLQHKNDFKNAEKYLLQAIKLNVDLTLDSLNMVLKTYEWDNIISITKKALKIYPKNEKFLGQVRFILVQAYYNKGEKDLALQELTKTKQHLTNAGALDSYAAYISDLENRLK